MREIIILFIFSFPAIGSLIPSGFFNSHDGNGHLIRFMHFYSELLSGQFPVRIAREMAYGYGYPIFNYFYPFIYYAASFFKSVGFTYGDSMKMVIAISTVGSVFFMYFFLKNLFNTKSALIGALIYLYVPYRFLITYVAGSFGAVAALFFIPLALYSSFELARSSRYRFGFLLSVSITGLVTSHNVTAMLFLPIILIYIFLFCKSSKQRVSFTRLFVFFILGMGMGVFLLYLLFLKLILLGLGICSQLIIWATFHLFRSLYILNEVMDTLILRRKTIYLFNWVLLSG